MVKYCKDIDILWIHLIGHHENSDKKAWWVPYVVIHYQQCGWSKTQTSNPETLKIHRAAFSARTPYCSWTYIYYTTGTCAAPQYHLPATSDFGWCSGRTRWLWGGSTAPGAARRGCTWGIPLFAGSTSSSKQARPCRASPYPSAGPFYPGFLGAYSLCNPWQWRSNLPFYYCCLIPSPFLIF